MPPIEYKFFVDAACSLGDKLYVFSLALGRKNSINILHYPFASISSQESLWQVIEVPQDVLSYRNLVTFVPLNSTKIAILGGTADFDHKPLGDVTIFNTITFEFTKTIEVNKVADSFYCA